MNRTLGFVFGAFGVLWTGLAFAAPPQPLPPLFGVEFDAPPSILLHRLEKLGYTMTSWTLEPPFSKRVYKAAREDDPFADVSVDMCNHPRRITRLSIRSHDAAVLYQVVKERFRLGLRQWDNNGPGGRYGRYAETFAGGARVTLEKDGNGAVLEIESGSEACHAAFEEDRQHLARTAQEAEAAGTLSRRESF